MTTKKKRFSIGQSDFRRLITDNLYFVDKSLFIKDVIDNNAVLLYPRPRRFGKTLNLSMLKYFYDCNADNSYLFDGLAISKEEDIMEKQGKHPVIFLTFKDVKPSSIEKCLQQIFGLISALFNEHQYLLSSDNVSKYDKTYIEKILSDTANEVEYQNSLLSLSKILYQHHNANPIILIDEYDTPIHAGFYHGYYEEIVDFIRIFFGNGLKDNTYLEKGVLTGILRVSKESIFSDLNNISVYSMLNESSADKFGFTDNEVEKMLAYFESPLPFSDIKKQYNGYNFSGKDIYNPWSILNAIQQKRLGAYWANTSSNNLIKSMCQEADETVKRDLETMLEGGKVKKTITDNIIFADLEEDIRAFWSFMVMCGYLRYDYNVNYNNKGKYYLVDLSIPNEDLWGIFNDDILIHWFKKPEKTDELIHLAEHLVSGDIEVFKQSFIEYCLNSFSYFDVSGTNPERFYHGFVLGLFTCLKDRYHIRSNRESGYGRYDVLLMPIDKSERGIIFEFKILDEAYGETFEKALESGKKQIIEQKYEQELRSLGVNDIVSIVAVFRGKEVRLCSS